MIRAIYFDAVGTLIHPRPSADEVYHDVGRRFGSRLSPEDIRRRFRRAFARQEELDRVAGWHTSESRELERWRTIVTEVLNDVANPADCFAELYEHFAGPRAWTVTPGAAHLLAQLRARGFGLGMASNYDRRLHQVVAGLRELHLLRHVVISSEIGWRKPAAEFFSTLCQRAALSPEQVLYIGDDPVNDHDGARAAGLHALLVDHSRDLAGQLDDYLRLVGPGDVS